MSKDDKIPKVVWVRKGAEGAPEAKPEPQFIDKETFRKLTDLMLERSGVPRDYLFEYPYNEFESDRLIARAEETVRKMADILKLRIEQ